MLKKIKKLFSKPTKSSRAVPPPIPFWAQNDFHTALEEYDEQVKEESKEATREINTFNRVTLDILEELQKEGHCNSFSFEPQNVRKASMGRIINKHLNRALFHQQLEDELDE